MKQSDDLTVEEKTMQNQIRNWYSDPVTKIMMKYLEDMSTGLWETFQTGHFLKDEKGHSAAIGKITLARYLSTLDDDVTVRELCELCPPSRTERK